MILGRFAKIEEIAETTATTLLLPLFLLFTYFLAALITLVILSIIVVFVKIPSISIFVFHLIVSFVATLIAADFFQAMALGKSPFAIILSYIISAILIGVTYVIFAIPAYAAFGTSIIISPIWELLASMAGYFVQGVIYGLIWGLIPTIYMIVLAIRK